MGVAILVASVLWLPDSFKPDTTLSLKPKPIISNFLSVVREPQFYTFSFTGAIAFAGLFAYVSGSPLVFMEVFHTSEKVYGWIFALLSVGFIGSSQLNTFLLRKYRSEQVINTALMCQVLISFVMLFASFNGLLTLTLTIILLFLFLCCIGLTYPNAAALSLAPFTKNAGSASALMGAIQMGMGAMISVVVSLFEEPSTFPMVLAMAGSSLLALCVFFIGRRTITQPIEAGADGGMIH
jgi:DHA1 family bicyclomycin/chloramphenicol resistance-like MFS transporter